MRNIRGSSEAVLTEAQRSCWRVCLRSIGLLSDVADRGSRRNREAPTKRAVVDKVMSNEGVVHDGSLEETFGLAGC